MDTRKDNAMSRRGFLKATALSTAAASMGPAIAPATILGRAGAVPPSDRITLGFIGLGKMMPTHIGHFIGMPECQAVAVCDVEGIRLERTKQRIEEHYAETNGADTYNGCDTYRDFRDLLSRDDIDAVVIATPEHWHAIPAIMAAKAGKDIYCEKPLGLTIGEGQAIVEAVRETGVVLQTGSQLRSQNGVRRACELVRNGLIGELHTVHVNPGSWPMVREECDLPAEPVPDELDWDMWLGQAPERPYHSDLAPHIDDEGWPEWRLYFDFAGGNLTDFGAHDFDKAQWGMGRDGSGPVEVLPANGLDRPHMTFRYDDGVVMYYGGARDQANRPISGRAQEFLGDEGRVIVRGGSMETDPPELADASLGEDAIRLYQNESHWQDWIQCIKERKQPVANVEVGHSSATICHLGNIAYLLDRPIEWDPETETFPNGDEEAEQYLSRDMRSPWSLDMSL